MFEKILLALTGGIRMSHHFELSAWRILMITLVEKQFITSADALKMTVRPTDDLRRAGEETSAAEPTEMICRDLEELAARFGRPSAGR